MRLQRGILCRGVAPRYGESTRHNHHICGTQRPQERFTQQVTNSSSPEGDHSGRLLLRAQSFSARITPTGTQKGRVVIPVTRLDLTSIPSPNSKPTEAKPKTLTVRGTVPDKGGNHRELPQVHAFLCLQESLLALLFNFYAADMLAYPPDSNLAAISNMGNAIPW